MVLDEIDSKILCEANKQAPLVTEPFKEIAIRLGLGPREVVARLARLQKNGVIRRFGAKIKPRDIGLCANAMVAWKVPVHRIQEVGSFLSKLSEVTHCYERETVLGKWEYNLYMVMHSQKRESIETAVRKLSHTLGIREYLILFSKANLKIGYPLQAELNIKTVLKTGFLNDDGVKKCDWNIKTLLRYDKTN